MWHFEETTSTGYSEVGEADILRNVCKFVKNGSVALTRKQFYSVTSVRLSNLRGIFTITTHSGVSTKVQVKLHSHLRGKYHNATFHTYVSPTNEVKRVQ